MQLPLLLGLSPTPSQGFWGCAELGAEWRYPKRKPRAPPGGPRWGLAEAPGLGPPFFGAWGRSPPPPAGPGHPGPAATCPRLGFPTQGSGSPSLHPAPAMPAGGVPAELLGFCLCGVEKGGLCAARGVVEQCQELGGLCRAPALPPPSPFGGAPPLPVAASWHFSLALQTPPGGGLARSELVGKQNQKVFWRGQPHAGGQEHEAGSDCRAGGGPCWGGGPGQGAPGSAWQLSSPGSEETRHPPFDLPQFPAFHCGVVNVPWIIIINYYFLNPTRAAYGETLRVSASLGEELFCLN